MPTAGSANASFSSSISPFCSRCGGVLPNRPIWMVNARACVCGSGMATTDTIKIRICPTCGKPKMPYETSLGRCDCSPQVQSPGAWQCPGCKRWKAPHVTECDCGNAE